MALREAACIIANVKVIVGGAQIVADLESALEREEALVLVVEDGDPSKIVSVRFLPTDRTHDLRYMKAYIGKLIGTDAVPASVIVTLAQPSPEAMLVMADAPPV